LGKIIAEATIGQLIGWLISVAAAAILAWVANPPTGLGFVILFLSVLGVLVLLWLLFALGWRLFHPITEASQGKPKASDIARVAWQQGFKNHQITNPWELKATIEYLRYASDTSCYARWGRRVGYLSGKQAWRWSTQHTLMTAQTVQQGKVDKYLIASIPPGDTKLHIFDDKVGGEQNHENLICVEIVVASAKETQRVRRHYGLVSTRGLVAVLIDESRFEEMADT
jgi:hypothetical protein